VLYPLSYEGKRAPASLPKHPPERPYRSRDHSSRPEFRKLLLYPLSYEGKCAKASLAKCMPERHRQRLGTWLQWPCCGGQGSGGRAWSARGHVWSAFVP